MYARVVSWEGGDADAIRKSTDDIRSQAGQGPPAGVPATGVLILGDPDGGRAMAITLFETMDDLRQGDATLNEMSPSQEMGTRGPVGIYEVALDMRV